MTQKMIDVRTDHDETQRELAKAIGYHQVQIARYETGENTPPIQSKMHMKSPILYRGDFIPKDGVLMAAF